MAYKYLTTARINSTIKKHNLEVVYKKGDGYFYFLDLTTKEQVGENVMIARMHHFTIQQWREAAELAAASRASAPQSTEAAQVRELVESLDDENCPF